MTWHHLTYGDGRLEVPERSRGVEHEMDAREVKRRRISENEIFLSHSGHEKPFVEQLYHDLKRADQHPFFDQDSDCLPKAKKFASKILEAAEQSQLAVVVVSEGYLSSKWPMLELSKFVECKVNLFPLFFNLSPSDLKQSEVETKWKVKWRKLVERGEVEEEVVELWSDAVRKLRSINGLEYAKFAKSEYRYRAAVVDEIRKLLPPIYEWSTDDIQGYGRLCEVTSSMFEAKASEGEKESHEYLGLYGMGGVGKTTLCKAMRMYFQGEFSGRVCHVVLGNNEAKERVARVKKVLQNLAGNDKTCPDEEPEAWEWLKKGLRNLPPVFLAIDNVGDLEDSRDEARKYLKELPSGSKVMVTARSEEIVESVLGEGEYCKPIPRLEWEEATVLFLSKAAPSTLSVLSLTLKESEIVKRCLSECQFAEHGFPSRQYHPLVLRALGTYFFDLNRGVLDVKKWEEALENKKKLQRSREAKKVNDMLGLNYHSLSDEVKLIFLDSAFYSYNEFYRSACWWCSKGRPSDYEFWISWISEVHGVSSSDARMMMKELQRLSLLEDAGLDVSVHDLYKEFARALVEKEGSKEWEWWMSREELGSSCVTHLKRLVLFHDKSLIGCAPRRLVEWRSLVFLELVECRDTGPVLELGGLNSLRVLFVDRCDFLERIVCSCGNDDDDEICCYKRKPGWGCMSELVTVRILQYLQNLRDVPFLRHCPNLQFLEIHPGYDSFPITDVPIDLGYLKALHTLSLSGGRHMLGYDVASFLGWLLAALQLENLTTLDYQSDVEGFNEVGGGHTLDLNEAVHLSSRLDVLSLRLPKEIEEVKGLHLLSELTTLNLTCSRGLRRLPDLRGLPKLKWMCVHGCCKLEAPPRLGPEVQGIWDEGFCLSGHFNEHYFKEHECLQPYCCNDGYESCLDCEKRMEDEWEESELSDGMGEESEL